MTYQLHPFQVYVRDEIIRRRRCALWLTMGMGKTLTTLSALEKQLIHEGNALVIAPPTIAKSVWGEEVQRRGVNVPYLSLVMDADHPNRKLSRAKRYELYERIAAGLDEPTLCVTNNCLVDDIVKFFTTRRSWPFATIILDESQSFKSYRSKRFKTLRLVAGKSRNLIQLTGTPIPHSYMDLWPQIFMIDGGATLGTSITQYRNQFCYPSKWINGQTVQWDFKDGAIDHINRLVKPYVIRVDDGHIALPPRHDDSIVVNLSKSEREAYRKFAVDSVIELSSVDDQGRVMITAANAAVLTSKLTQFASGSIYDEDKTAHQVHSRKVDALVERVRQIRSKDPDNPPSILVAYYYHFDVDMIKAALAAADLPCTVFDKSPDMIHDWNEGNVPIMLIQPGSAGHGLNLQYGGHHLIWFTLPWSLESYMQTCARLHRQGQVYPTYIDHLIVADSIDARIISRLNQRAFDQSQLLQSVVSDVMGLSDDIKQRVRQRAGQTDKPQQTTP